MNKLIKLFQAASKVAPEISVLGKLALMPLTKRLDEIEAVFNATVESLTYDSGSTSLTTAISWLEVGLYSRSNALYVAINKLLIELTDEEISLVKAYALAYANVIRAQIEAFGIEEIASIIGKIEELTPELLAGIIGAWQEKILAGAVQPATVIDEVVIKAEDNIAIPIPSPTANVVVNDGSMATGKHKAKAGTVGALYEEALNG